MATATSIAPPGTPLAESGGINLPAHKLAALAKPAGQQRAEYLRLVAADIGNNAVVSLIRNGTVMYRTTTPTLTVQAGLLRLPNSLPDPDISTPAPNNPAWKIRVANANNAGVFIEAPAVLSNHHGAQNPILFDFVWYAADGLDSQWELTAINGGLQDSSGTAVKLVGGNMYAACMPYRVAEFYETDTELDAVCKFNALESTLNKLAADHPNLRVIRITWSPLVFLKDGAGEWVYPAQVQYIIAFIEAAAARGWWVMMSLYGMGSYSDLVSRSRNQQTGANPNLPNHDESQPAEDGTQDSTNNAAIRAEVKDVLSRAIPALRDCQNVIWTGINEWRQISAQEWHDSEKDIRDYVRNTLNYYGLWISDGYNWAINLDVDLAKALVASDPAGPGHQAFSVHAYIDQGTVGSSNEAVTKLMKPATRTLIDDGVTVIVGEYGNQIELSSLNAPQTITEQEILDWQTEYVRNHLDAAMLLSWQLSVWDQHSHYNDRLAGWFGPVQNAVPLSLNPTGTHRIALASQWLAGEVTGELPGQAELQTAIEAAMIKTGEFQEARILHGWNADAGKNYPEATRYSPYGTNDRYWPESNFQPGYSDPEILPFTHLWEMATAAWGQPHVQNPAHAKVAKDLRDWWLCLFFEGDADWTIAYKNRGWEIEGSTVIYDGQFNAIGQPDNIITLPSGRKTTVVQNANGITSATQVRIIHSWPTSNGTNPVNNKGNAFYQIPVDKRDKVLAIATGYLARAVPVNGGTLADVQASRGLDWTGTDIYTISGQNPTTRPGTMVGKPRFLTDKWKWITAHAHRDGEAASNQFVIDHKLPNLVAA